VLVMARLLVGVFQIRVGELIARTTACKSPCIGEGRELLVNLTFESPRGARDDPFPIIGESSWRAQSVPLLSLIMIPAESKRLCFAFVNDTPWLAINMGCREINCSAEPHQCLTGRRNDNSNTLY